jgi:hypothetical protein
MDSNLRKNYLRKYEEIFLVIVLMAGLLFMVAYWK